MIYEIDISIEDALQLHNWHYQYWIDYKSSTVLVDADGKIISYYDRSSKDILIIKLYTYHKWKWYFANWKFTKWEPSTFINYDFSKIYRLIPKEDRAIYMNAIYDYNSNFFLWKIKQESINILEKLKKYTSYWLGNEWM